MPKPVRELLRLVHVERLNLSRAKKAHFEVIDHLKSHHPELYQSLRRAVRTRRRRPEEFKHYRCVSRMREHSGGEALARASDERPDLLIDVSTPRLSALAVAALIKAREAPPKVVMTTLEDREEHRISALVAGANGFLPKENFSREWHSVVETLFGAVSG